MRPARLASQRAIWNRIWLVLGRTSVSGSCCRRPSALELGLLGAANYHQQRSSRGIKLRPSLHKRRSVNRAFKLGELPMSICQLPTNLAIACSLSPSLTTSKPDRACSQLEPIRGHPIPEIEFIRPIGQRAGRDRVLAAANCMMVREDNRQMKVIF